MQSFRLWNQWFSPKAIISAALQPGQPDEWRIEEMLQAHRHGSGLLGIVGDHAGPGPVEVPAILNGDDRISAGDNATQAGKLPSDRSQYAAERFTIAASRSAGYQDNHRLPTTVIFFTDARQSVSIAVAFRSTGVTVIEDQIFMFSGDGPEGTAARR